MLFKDSDTSRKQVYGKHILSLLLFGFNGIIASRIFLSSYAIVLMRTLIGGGFLLLVFIFKKEKFYIFQNKRQLRFIVISGLAMGASWMLLYEAYTKIGVSFATLAYYCGPVIVMFLSPFIFHERMVFSKILGFLSVLVGMLCVNGLSLLREGLSWGLFCGILSAVMYAVMVIFNKKATGINGLENALCQLCVSFAAVGFFTLIKEGGGMVLPGVESLLPILFLGIVNTGIGCYLYFSSIPKMSAQTVSILGYIEPLSALLFATFFLHERLSIVQGIGAVLILGGAAFGELFHKKELKKVE